MKSDRPWQPSVLVLDEKHGPVYMNALTKENLHNSALAILKGRFEQRWYYDPRQENKPKKPELTQEQIDALPDGEVKRTARRQWSTYVNELRDYEYDCEMYANIKTAIETNDGELAWDILRKRREYEYERVDLKPLREKY